MPGNVQAPAPVGDRNAPGGLLTFEQSEALRSAMDRYMRAGAGSWAASMDVLLYGQARLRVSLDNAGNERVERLFPWERR